MRASRLLLKAVHRTIGPLLPPTVLSRRYAGVPGRIHVDDQMLRAPTPAGLEHYVTDAQCAMRNLDATLQATQRSWRDLESVLDLPSGYGRVTRHLVARIPADRITACDLDRQAVRFCAAEFGVKALASKPDLRDVAFPERYDLIFMGSLLTHLAEDACRSTLEALARALRPGGLLVFTTQGESCLAHLDWYGARFAAAEPTYRARVARTGMCFVPYRDGGDYGVTIHARAWVERAVAGVAGGLSPIRFAERGWDRHQDVWSYQRTA
jgi:SAM-dependent methyltransferase